MPYRRDTQKSKVYKAEHFLWGATVGTTVPEVQAYVNRLTDYAWFRRRWGSRRIKVQAQKGLGGHGGHGTITVGMNATAVRGHAQGAQRCVVLHEMAHCLAVPSDGNWHGPEFARTMLELVRYAIDEETADKLRAAYKQERVKVGSPTRLRAVDKTPPARPTPRTYRAQIGDETVAIEATSLLAALDTLTSAHGIYREMLKKTDGSEIRVWKSRKAPTNSEVIHKLGLAAKVVSG